MEPFEFDVKNVRMDSMRVLGVELDKQMMWNRNVDKVIMNGNSTITRPIQGLRILRRNYGLDDFLGIMTSRFFSKIYYAGPAWLGCLSKKYLKRLDSLDYSALRVAFYDHKQNISRDLLDHDYRRGTQLNGTNIPQPEW